MGVYWLGGLHQTNEILESPVSGALDGSELYVMADGYIGEYIVDK